MTFTDDWTERMTFDVTSSGLGRLLQSFPMDFSILEKKRPPGAISEKELK
jgi:hypothetical protein